MGPLTQALAHAQLQIRAGGAHAVTDPRDVSPPCVLVLPAAVHALAELDITASWAVRLRLLALADGPPAAGTIEQLERLAVVCAPLVAGDDGAPSWDFETWTIPATGGEVAGLSTTITLTIH